MVPGSLSRHMRSSGMSGGAAIAVGSPPATALMNTADRRSEVVTEKHQQRAVVVAGNSHEPDAVEDPLLSCVLVRKDDFAVVLLDPHRRDDAPADVVVAAE